MIHLIVNADDLGINANRDRGILEAYQRGIVTSSTLIANGRSFDSAVRQAKEANLAIGVHLNLSEGTTLSGPITGLTVEGHRLPGKIVLRQYLLSETVDQAGIRREFSAQIDKVMNAGLTPKHLDGHQHCHAYPAIAGVVVSLAKEYGIDAMRSVRPAESGHSRTPEELVGDIRLFQQIGRHTDNLYSRERIRTTSGLWGHAQLNSLDTSALCALLEAIPQGQWELMVHPGYPDPRGRHFESSQRQAELTALCSEDAQEVIQRRGIRLSTFGDLPCAS